MIRRKKREIPELNTTALPDLIFTVLFFFMIVTHMRDNSTSIQIKTPTGTNLQKIERHYATTYLFIGKDTQGKPLIQINEREITLEEITKYVIAEKQKISDEEEEGYKVCIKADSDIPLYIISQVEENLQRAGVRNISLIATSIKKNY